MFNFRLINTKDGNQIIDTSLKTPYESITPIDMQRQERKRQKEAVHTRRFAHNPLWKLACICGMAYRRKRKGII